MGKGDHTRVSVTAFPGDEIDRVDRESFEDSVKLRLQRQNRRRGLEKSGANEAKQRRAKERKLIAPNIAKELPQTSGKLNRAKRVRERWPDKDDVPSISTIYRLLKE